MTPTFDSAFAVPLRAFVDQKHALGHPYAGSIDILRQFDAMCVLEFPGRRDLGQDICMAWAVKRPAEGRDALRNRTAAIREFARYLTRLGESAYLLPPALTRKGPRHVPHIYTPDEIAAIWQAADDTPPLPGYPIRHLVIPAILRLIYCCGLRPVEARTLPVSAVDLDRGRIDIAESKGHKNRQVWMADDLTAYCRVFHAHACRLLPGRTVFFSDSHGNAYTKVWLDKTFRTVRARAGITPAGKHQPRLYDLRHSMATHRLYQWARQGKNLTAALPYLSAYMGHAQLSDTYYYIHLVPDTAQPMTADVFSTLLPEVDSHE
jgi:integrase/recombinase XerD